MRDIAWWTLVVFLCITGVLCLRDAVFGPEIEVRARARATNLGAFLVCCLLFYAVWLLR